MKYSKRKPKSVMIMGHKVTVKWVRALADDEEGALGRFLGDEDTLFIREHVQWKKTYFHELVHAVLYYSGHTSFFKTVDEEALVRALENGLWPLVKSSF